MGIQRTQVGTVGAGSAGLMLAHLLRLAGVETVVLESRTRAYSENRVRAGLLEQGSIDLRDEIGASDRLHREALVHDGIHVRYDGRNHCVSIKEPTGKSLYIYGQQESVKDLIGMHLAAGGDVRLERTDVSIEALDGDRAARFSRWMTSLTHRFNDRLDFDNVVQLSELQYITSSRAGAETLAERYRGLPIER